MTRFFRAFAALLLLAEPTVTLAVALDREASSCCAEEECPDEACPDEPSSDPCDPGCADCLCCPRVRTMALTPGAALREPAATPIEHHSATLADPVPPDPFEILHVPKHDT